MASYTNNLNLLKKDPVADGSDTFNIQTMMNDNWDKLDAQALKAQAAKTAPADADKVPVIDSADASKTKLILWSGIKTAMSSVFAALSHSHTKSQITDFPTSMTPTAHKSTHATGGGDALTPSDIGVWNKDEVLDANTRALLTLACDATPTEALFKLGLGTGYNAYLVTVKDSKGNPVSNVTVTGLTTLSGGSAITDSQGQVIGKNAGFSVTVSVTSPYIDLQNVAATTVTASKTVTPINLTMLLSNDLLYLTASKTFKFSPRITSFDVCGVGGGGGGASWYQPGGGGGYVSNLLNVTPDYTASYTANIGAGGNPGSTTSNVASERSGSSGGTSSLLKNGGTVLAAGGGSGGNYDSGGGGGGPGAGNGAGGGRNQGGVAGSVHLFNDPSLPLFSGGGAGGSQSSNYAGGAPYGGDSQALGYGGDGKGYGGGGAGGSEWSPNVYRGGYGYQGCIVLRMRWAT